jgi:hypothetical protein
VAVVAAVSGNISKNHLPATTAEDRFTYAVSVGPQWYRLSNIENLLDEARADGVPGDAVVQLSGDRLYLHWTRPA